MSALLGAPLLPAAAGAVCIALAVKFPAAHRDDSRWFWLRPSRRSRSRARSRATAMLVRGRVSSLDLRAGKRRSALPMGSTFVRGPLDGVRKPRGAAAPSIPARGRHPAGIVLGERAAVSADLAAAFARSGTSHLLAISGFNMTLVATAVAIVARGRVRPAITALLTVGCVIAYSVLVGLAPSVARAAVMAVVASLGLAFGRRPATDNALALAIATMVGSTPRRSGRRFALSATAPGGLLYLGDPLSRRLAFFPGGIREGLATTLAATLPTIPIIAAVFGRVSLVSPFANLVAVPLFPPLMIAGAVTAALGTISLDLAQAPALLAYALAYLLRLVVETSAALPLASLAVPDGPLAGPPTAPRWHSRSVGPPRRSRGCAASCDGLASGRHTWPCPLRLPRQAVWRCAPARLRSRHRWSSRLFSCGRNRPGYAFGHSTLARAMLPSGIRWPNAADRRRSGPRRGSSRSGASLHREAPHRRRRATHAHAITQDGLIGVLERYGSGSRSSRSGLSPAPWPPRGAIASRGRT